MTAVPASPVRQLTVPDGLLELTLPALVLFSTSPAERPCAAATLSKEGSTMASSAPTSQRTSVMRRCVGIFFVVVVVLLEVFISVFFVSKWTSYLRGNADFSCAIFIP